VTGWSAGRPSTRSPRPAAVTTNLEFKTIETLPMDRNYAAMLTMVPQVDLFSELPATAGALAGRATIVDGAIRNRTRGQWGSPYTNLPYNFIQEIEVTTGGFQAEYGRATGGIVNAITPSGGNEIRGSVFGFFTNDHWLARIEILSRSGRTGVSAPSTSVHARAGPMLFPRPLWYFPRVQPSLSIAPIPVAGPPTGQQ